VNFLFETHPTLRNFIASFLIDRQSNGLAKSTVRFYRDYLEQVASFFEASGITTVEGITPDALRAFLVTYAERHNPGGCHAVFRSIRTFLRWYEAEYEPPGYKNPLHKVKAPKVPIQQLIPVSLEDVSALLAICKGHTKYDKRDQAIILTLIDTGIRAGELMALTIPDVNLMTGEILIRHGKSKRPRAVFAGQRTRKALRSYIRARRDDDYVFLSRLGERFNITGLRAVIKRRAREAGIKAPSLHSFRRAFAINCLRAGMDVFSLQRLMGHTDLSVLRRYLAQSTADLSRAHRAASPADNLPPPGLLAKVLFSNVIKKAKKK